MDTTSSHTELTTNFFHQQNSFQNVLKDIYIPVIKAVKPTKRHNTDVSVYRNDIFSSNIAVLKWIQ